MEGYDVEDEVADYKFLSANGIPKRGEKEVEPVGSNDQLEMLKESRNAMYQALEGVRGHHSKHKLVAIWMENENRAIIPHVKGNFFRDIGQPLTISNKIKGGLSLNSLETVFLVERGSMVIYLSDELLLHFLYGSNDDDAFDYESLQKLDLAYLYSLAFDGEYSIDDYQIYTYLKRLGYLILPFKQIKPQKPKTTTNIFATVFQSIWKSPIIETVLGLFNKVGILAYPIFSSLHYFSKHYLNYSAIFKSLNLIKSYQAFESLNESPKSNPHYKLAFNVWKPTPTFSKKNPPIPDFQICIINTNTTKFPDLQTIHAIFNEINYQETPIEKPKFKKKNTMQPSKRELRLKRQQERQSKLDELIQIRNKYLKSRDDKYKYGFRSFIIAIVNEGIINFVNLAEGDFSLRKCDQLDEFMTRDHGLVYMEKS